METVFPIKVLYVEDDAAIRRVCSSYLRKVFSEVVTANDGEEALALMSQGLPDLLVTDVRMPVLDGFGLIKKVVERYSTIPVIVTSASNDSEALRHAASMGVKAFFDKPFKLDRLRQEIISQSQSVSGEQETRQMAVYPT